MYISSSATGMNIGYVSEEEPVASSIDCLTAFSCVKSQFESCPWSCQSRTKSGFNAVLS